MFKNIKFSELFKSKTFLGAALALVCEALKVLFPGNQTVFLLIQLLGGLLGTVGFVDRTSPTTIDPTTGLKVPRKF